MAGASRVSVRIVNDRLPSIPPELRADAAAEVARSGFEIEAAAKAKAPVLTGTLRRSIHTVISANKLTATVGPSVDYGIYVEMGTRRMAARPYMRPAAELVYPKFADRMKALLRGLGR